MESAYSTLRFYIQLGTGMVLLLNIALLVSIRLNMKAGRHSPNGERPRPAHKGLLAALMILVIAGNAVALYANHRLRLAAEGILQEAGLLESPSTGTSRP